MIFPWNLIIGMCFSLIFFSDYALCDNPTAIVKPYDGPDPGYILAESGTIVPYYAVL